MNKTQSRIPLLQADPRYTTLVPWVVVDRWVCNRGHPHPTQEGAEACEAARAGGATDAQLYALLAAEVAKFNG